MSEKFDLIVIGAGPGGYVAAIRGAQKRLHVAVVEADRAGGTCLNRGCIPTKAMIHASSLYREMKEGGRFGVYAEGVSYDYEKICEYKQETVGFVWQNNARNLFPYLTAVQNVMLPMLFSN